MASIISVDTLQDSAGSNEITTANVKTAFDNSAKFWCFYGTVTSTGIDRSFNVSSLTDEGTGDTDVNLTNGFVDANIVGHINIGNGGNGDQSFIQTSTTATVIECFQYNGNNAAFDSDYCAVSGHGDLA